MGTRPRSRVLAAAALALPALALVAGVPGTASAAASARPPALTADPGSPASTGATSSSGSLELTSLSPAVVRPGQSLIVTGVVHNDGSTALTRPVVRVVLGRMAATREDVQTWAAGSGPAEGDVIGQTQLTADVAPGGAGSFRVTVTGLANRSQGATYGALPISVETGTSSVRTFAGFQRIKQYQPMSIAWAVPLTLDPDPDLFGAKGPAREAAWQQALGAASRVNRVIDATRGASVTWAIDPTLTPLLLEDSVDSPPTGSEELALRRSTESLIGALAPSHTPWVLPDTDADVGAVAGSGQGEPLMEALVARAAPVAAALGGRADIAWPADGAYTTSGEAGLRRMYKRPALAGQVTATGAVQPAVSGMTPPAAQRSATGLPLLSYDQSLSALLARTTSATEAVLSTQQFVAESAALLNELPGTSGRTAFVVAPRSFNPDPAAAQRFLASAATIPWLTPTTTDAELAAAKHAAASSGGPVTRPSNPSAGGPPVLTTARLTALSQTMATVQGVAQIRDDGDEFRETWTRAAEQLASTRWRGAPTAWNTLAGRVAAATRETTTAVKVAAGTINFLAESGRLQITVTNDLDVPVKDVKLTVEASNPRLQIDSQPSVLRIGPKSRATVTVRVTALAAGLVPLRTTLTTPDGTVIGQGADVLVRVTPTGSWVYWGLGGLALAILLLGIVRSLRRRPSRAPRPAAPPPPATSGHDQPAPREAHG
jgi:hypothetical protein